MALEPADERVAVAVPAAPVAVSTTELVTEPTVPVAPPTGALRSALSELMARGVTNKVKVSPPPQVEDGSPEQGMRGLLDSLLRAAPFPSWLPP